MRLSAASGLLRSSPQISGSAPTDFTAAATSSSATAFRAASTTPEKSRATRMEVDRPIPWLAPVTIATDWFIILAFLNKHFLCSGNDDLYDLFRRSKQRCMVDVKRMSTSPHSLCHEMMCFGIDHAVAKAHHFAPDKSRSSSTVQAEATRCQVRTWLLSWLGSSPNRSF